VDHDGVALAGEGEHGVELGPVDVLARCFVGENPVERLPFQLAIDILIECADPDVTNPLAFHRHPPYEFVRLKSVTRRDMRQ
jgi:hypothetical protein